MRFGTTTPLSAQSFVYNRSRRKIVEFINFVSRPHAVEPPSTTRKMIFFLMFSVFRVKIYFCFYENPSSAVNNFFQSPQKLHFFYFHQIAMLCGFEEGNRIKSVH